jgi:hypothetical protein
MGANAKPQTPDPLASHAVSGAKITGRVDFSGQDQYDEQAGDTPEGELSDGRVDIHGGMSRAKFLQLDNESNGSGGSCTTIAPGKVRGSNP